MKGSSILFSTPLVFGLAAGVFGLEALGNDRFGAWEWCLAIVLVPLAGLIVGSVLNFAIFTPVYWLLGRLHSRRLESKSEADFTNQK